MNDFKNDLILLFSGGYDSTLLLELALEMQMKPLCVLVEYGQKHVDELDFAKKMCEEKKVDWVPLHITLPVPSNLTEEPKTYPGVDPHHVPARNLIFVGLAASLAEAYDIPLIWYGANYEDREKLFPDCYQEWVYQINKLLEINGSRKVTVEAPLLGMSKPLIKQLAFYFGITNNKVFSGYGE